MTDAQVFIFVITVVTGVFFYLLGYVHGVKR